jgi:single-strand DNA-binding protein
MQRIQVLGNVGNDPTVRTLESGAIAIQFNIAVTEKFKDKENTNWYSATIWRTPAQGDNVSQYIRKGDKIFVEGNPNARAYTNKDGVLVASLEINVRNFEFLSKRDNSAKEPTVQNPQPVQQTTDTFISDMEDLPF